MAVYKQNSNMHMRGRMGKVNIERFGLQGEARLEIQKAKRAVLRAEVMYLNRSAEEKLFAGVP